MEDLRLQDTIVFLAAAGLIIPIFKRFNVSPVLGFILVGLCLGPNSLPSLVGDYGWLKYVLINDPAGVSALAELGVIFLLFMIGLELSLERLWAMRRLVLGMGTSQIVLTATVIGYIAWCFDNSVQASIILGASLALSSTAIVLQLLTEQGRFGSPAGHSSFAILLAQDIAVVPILFLVAGLGSSSQESVALGFGLALLKAALTLLMIYGVGKVLLRPLFALVGHLKSPELFMATTLLIIIATAAITHSVGLSAALGAFLAGLLLAESEFRHEIELNIEPFKGLLMGLFFMSMAMDIDLREFGENPSWIVLSIFGLVLIKSIITTTTARLFGFSWRHAGETGILLAQGGEFAFVVLALALSANLLPEATGQFMLIVVSATMFLTPLGAWFSLPIGEWLEVFVRRLSPHTQETKTTDLDRIESLTDHIIIVGFGRTGALLAQLLDHQMVPYLALDVDPSRVAQAKLTGASVNIGNASRENTLRKVHLNKARALVICTDDTDANEHVIHAARRLSKHIPIIARARDEQQASLLADSGASVVVPEVLEAGLQLGQALLQEIGVPAHVAVEIVGMKRVEKQHRPA